MERRHTHLLALGLCAALLLGGAVVLLGIGGDYPGERQSRRSFPEESARGGRAGEAGLAPDASPLSGDAASGDPAEDDAVPRQVPPVMFGPEKLEGRVVDEQGRGVPDATVRCVPFFFEAPSFPADERFRTRANAAGWFAFERLPRTGSYRLFAAAEDRYGELEVREPGEGVHLVQTAAWRYQLLSFVDEMGRPVRVGRVQFQGPEFRGGALSTAGPVGRWKVRVLEILGVTLPVAEHEIAVFYEGEARPGPDRTFRFPGYAPAPLPNRVRPISEWPRKEEVRLAASDIGEDVVYEVRFPELPWPRSWRSPPDVRIYWIWKDSNLATVLSRHSHSLVGRRGRVFKLRASYQVQGQGQKTLPYKTRPGGPGRVLVEPEYPPLGFVTLVYPSERASGVLVNGYQHLRGSNEWPGRARIGPLPPGTYHLVRWWAGERPGERGDEDILEFQVTEGHQRVRWE